MDNTTRFILMFSGIWCFIGLIFLIIGIVMRHRILDRQTRCTYQTVGTVVDLVEHTRRSSDGHTSTTIHPVISYYVNGSEYVQKSSYGSSPSPYETGQAVSLLYDPQKPEDFLLPEDKTPRRLYIAFIITAICCFVVPIVVAVMILYRGI